MARERIDPQQGLSYEKSDLHETGRRSDGTIIVEGLGRRIRMPDPNGPRFHIKPSSGPYIPSKK